MGALIALSVNQQLVARGGEPLNIVIPVASERQKNVLKDELQGCTDTERIMLDEQAGAILNSVLTSQGDFAKHMQVLHDEYAATQKALNNRFGKQAKQPFNVCDLAGQELTINPQQIVGSLDTGGRVAINTTRRDFAFPVLTSELIHAAKKYGICASSSQLAKVESLARAEDKLYGNRFVPLVHTLSGSALSKDPTVLMRQKFRELLAQPKDSQAGTLIFTPPMKNVPTAKPFNGIASEGVYAMLSGHGPGEADIFKATIRAAKGAKLKVYTNPWADPVKNTVRISPKALSDPRIKTVISRAGWGTGWQLFNLGKPWLVIPVQKGDDPEIQLNHDALLRLGVAAVIDPETFDANSLKQYINKLSPRVRELRDLTTKRFGTSNGITYIAQRLANEYLA